MCCLLFSRIFLNALSKPLFFYEPPKLYTFTFTVPSLNIIIVYLVEDKYTS